MTNPFRLKTAAFAPSLAKFGLGVEVPEQVWPDRVSSISGERSPSDAVSDCLRTALAMPGGSRLLLRLKPSASREARLGVQLLIPPEDALLVEGNPPF